MPRKSTRAQEIQAALADDIVHGRIAPGEPLDEVRLAQSFKVSRTPIREAIRQLEAIGLAEARPHRGAVAAFVPEGRLDEMFAAMAELESVCARWSALNMTAKERQALEALHAEGGGLVSAASVADYAEYNLGFHDMIYRGSHNSFVAELASSVRRRIAPFRKAQFEGLGRLLKSHAEHGRVVDAILGGDADAAATEMRAHILVVRSAVDDVLPRTARKPDGGQAAASLRSPDFSST